MLLTSGHSRSSEHPDGLNGRDTIKMTVDRFADLKARQALTWGAAPFERITETFAEIHDRLIGHLGPRPGERWLDVATGTGPLALRAARAGATVTGVDLAPARCSRPTGFRQPRTDRPLGGRSSALTGARSRGPTSSPARSGPLEADHLLHALRDRSPKPTVSRGRLDAHPGREVHGAGGAGGGTRVPGCPRLERGLGRSVPARRNGRVSSAPPLLDPEPPGKRFAEDQALLVLAQLPAVMDQSAVPVGRGSLAHPGEHRLPQR